MFPTHFKFSPLAFLVAFFGIYFLAAVPCTYAQSNYTEKSDPEATKILKKLKSVYSRYDAIEIDYTLEIENGQDKEVQQGNILQQGDKYRINNNGNILHFTGRHAHNSCSGRAAKSLFEMFSFHRRSHMLQDNTPFDLEDHIDLL